ncbi:MAG: rhodanese-like domain-containing protein [Notoacmeibacter sp.]
MPDPIALTELSIENLTIIDVRKAPARKKSGLTMPGVVWRKPFMAESWWQEFAGQKVVVFCVYGHEVGMAVAGFLNDQGIDARYLEGGFEAYREAGGAVEAINKDD